MRVRNKNLIGASTPRPEGWEKVTGRATYAVDVTLPDMLWGKVLRSPLPYARIKKINARRAAALPGVRSIITGSDVRGMRIGRKIYDMPILADDVVRFAGEKVAAVAAESEAIAAEAAELIEVEYEELEPVLDPLAAAVPSAPLLHPDILDYRGLLHEMDKPSNVFVDLVWKKGDVELGFRQSDLIVENAFVTAPVHQAYIEPHSCVVRADLSGSAEIWACSKVPVALRDQVAAAVGIARDQLVVRPCYIGGCFGGKGDFMDVPLGYLLSLKARRPVKMVMDYAEEFIAGNPRHGAVVKVKTGVKTTGELVTHKMEYVFDSGAYGAFKPIGYLHGPEEAAGPYRIPHVFVEEKIVYTNKVPCGHMRAPGDPQGFFANESQMDIVARRLGMDPVRFRRKNLMRDHDTSPTGRSVPHIRAVEALEQALRLAGYRRRKNPHTGRGIAVAHWLPLGGVCSVRVAVDSEGGVTIASAMLDQGAGTYASMRQIVAQELKVPLEQVRVEILGTARVDEESGVGASRCMRIYGNAAYQAAIEVRVKLLDAAAEFLRADRRRLTLAGDGTVRSAGEKISYAEVARRLGSAISAKARYDNAEVGPEASVCVQVAEVEVDPETGEVKLKKFTSSHSTGTVINPLMHQGQIDGGVVMGMGYALMEQLVVENGKVVTANFGENKIPTVCDVPPLTTAVLENPVGHGPYGSMSIGETPVVPVAAAVANAVCDAVGARITDLPITAEKVLAALRKGKAGIRKVA